MVRRAGSVGAGALLALLVLAVPASAKGPMELGISGGALQDEIRIAADVFMRYRDSGRTWTAGAEAPADRSGPVYSLTEYLIVPDRTDPVPIVTWTYYPARSRQAAVARFSQANSSSNEWWTPHPDFERFVEGKIADAISAQGILRAPSVQQPPHTALPDGVPRHGTCWNSARGRRRATAALACGEVRLGAGRCWLMDPIRDSSSGLAS